MRVKGEDHVQSVPSIFWPSLVIVAFLALQVRNQLISLPWIEHCPAFRNRSERLLYLQIVVPASYYLRQPPQQDPPHQASGDLYATDPHVPSLLHLLSLFISISHLLTFLERLPTTQDERFAWRMFSPLGQRVKCSVVHSFVNGTVLPVNRYVGERRRRSS